VLSLAFAGSPGRATVGFTTGPMSKYATSKSCSMSEKSLTGLAEIKPKSYHELKRKSVPSIARNSTNGLALL
jgi:hypothetical protein